MAVTLVADVKQIHGTQSCISRCNNMSIFHFFVSRWDVVKEKIVYVLALIKIKFIYVFFHVIFSIFLAIALLFLSVV
jgi:hypothetical protein